MWDFFQTVRLRHSVRKYQTELPVAEEKLHAILETASAAPSAGDLQSYHMVVVRSAAQREALAATTEDQAFIAEAPLSIVFCSDKRRAADKYGERGKNLYAVQDATIAAAYAQLAVVAAGMGSTWIGHFDEDKVSDCLHLEPHLQAIAILSIGYPAEIPEATPRRNLDQIVSYQ